MCHVAGEKSRSGARRRRLRRRRRWRPVDSSADFRFSAGQVPG